MLVLIISFKLKTGFITSFCKSPRISQVLMCLRHLISNISNIYMPLCLSIGHLLVEGSEVIVSRTRLSCVETFSVWWIAATDKLLDDNLDTCETFEEHSDPFLYIWWYVGETIGPIHVYVISNNNCWPQMAPRVMRMTFGGNIEHCTPRTGESKHGNSYNVCRHHCMNDGTYLVIKLPMRGGRICEIRLN